MTAIDRRLALSLAAVALTATAAAARPALAQGAEGITRQRWASRESMIPGYARIAMRDVIYQPGAKTSNPMMPNDMVCHVPQGELRVKQTDGAEFVARQGDVWTCRKGIGEDLENIGSTVAIMRIIDLIPA